MLSPSCEQQQAILVRTVAEGVGGDCDARTPQCAANVRLRALDYASRMSKHNMEDVASYATIYMIAFHMQLLA